MMQIKDLKLLFDNGNLKKVTVIKAPMSENYLLLCDKHVLQAQRGGDRHFKSIDAAVENAQKIGFKQVTVRF